MKKTALIITIVLSANACKSTDTTLKDVFNNNFLIGVAITPEQCTTQSKAGKIVTDNFNSVVAENCMKSGVIQPEEGNFYFSAADSIVNFANQNGLFMIGHCLIWHSQTPQWFFVDSNGNDVSREVMIERMKTHITTLVGRYKGRVQGWDVVNEALNDDGTLRHTPFYRIIGEDYIQLAFKFAHEADPEAELYYNDYSLFKPEKCQGTIQLIDNLRTNGIQINAVGMQGHYLPDDPSPETVEASIVAFAQANIPVMITEMDVSVLPFPDRNKIGAEISTNFEYQQQMNPYSHKLPADIAAKWEAQILSYFSIFVEHSDKIKRVTLWGLSDSDSWKNDWPMQGRTDYPLLYDRNYNPKPVVEKIKQTVNKINTAKQEK